jgi:hypothetical protein
MQKKSRETSVQSIEFVDYKSAGKSPNGTSRKFHLISDNAAITMAARYGLQKSLIALL